MNINCKIAEKSRITLEQVGFGPVFKFGNDYGIRVSLAMAIQYDRAAFLNFVPVFDLISETVILLDKRIQVEILDHTLSLEEPK